MFTINPDFLISSIISGILIGSVYSLIAMGLALIWGIMDIINFAQGDYMMLGAFITYWLLVIFGVDPFLSVPISFAIVFFLGVLTQRFVIDKILHAPMVSQITATFALLLILRYGAEAAFGPYTRRVNYGFEILRFGVVSMEISRVIAFAVSIITTLVLYLFLTKTYYGIAIRAISQNRDAALLMGINVKKIYRLAFGIGVGLSAIGGSLLSTFLPIYPEMGGFFCLIAFIIVVFGGFGSVFGAYISGLIIGMAETVSALFVTPTLKDVVAFVLFIIIILIKPTGLFGK